MTVLTSPYKNKNMNTGQENNTQVFKKNIHRLRQYALFSTQKWVLSVVFILRERI